MFKHIFKLSTAAVVLVPTVYLAKEHKKANTKTYIWGNGNYQARPDALLQFKNFTPKEIATFVKDKSLKALAFGELYEAGIDQNNKLLVWPAKSIDANEDPNNPNPVLTRQDIKVLEKDVEQVRFTKGYIWALTSNGNVFQWPIQKSFDDSGYLTNFKIGEKRHVKPFVDIARLATGGTYYYQQNKYFICLWLSEDHVVALNKKGEVFAMGDDTLGQCGQPDNRQTCPPFFDRRITFPTRVNGLPKIKKIVAGRNHTLALDEVGAIYGWGSNSKMQLSHEEEFSKMAGALLCSYNPIKINKAMDNNLVVNIAAGGEFSFASTVNRLNESPEVFSWGNNTRGQLAQGLMTHIKDVHKVDTLSNYVISKDGKDVRVEIQQMECGNKHCIALLNIGYVMEWGDNEYGQLGNKKRSPSNRPIVIRDFINKKVVGVFAGQNSSGVIIEDS